MLRDAMAFLKNLIPPRVPTHSIEDHNEIVKKVVSSVATGSVSLQAGRFVTKRNIEDRKELLACYKF